MDRDPVRTDGTWGTPMSRRGRRIMKKKGTWKKHQYDSKQASPVQLDVVSGTSMEIERKDEGREIQEIIKAFMCDNNHVEAEHGASQIHDSGTATTPPSSEEPRPHSPETLNFAAVTAQDTHSDFGTPLIRTRSPFFAAHNQPTSYTAELESSPLDSNPEDVTQIFPEETPSSPCYYDSPEGDNSSQEGDSTTWRQRSLRDTPGKVVGIRFLPEQYPNLRPAMENNNTADPFNVFSDEPNTTQTGWEVIDTSYASLIDDDDRSFQVEEHQNQSDLAMEPFPSLDQEWENVQAALERTSEGEESEGDESLDDFCYLAEGQYFSRQSIACTEGASSLTDAIMDERRAQNHVHVAEEASGKQTQEGEDQDHESGTSNSTATSASDIYEIHREHQPDRTSNSTATSASDIYELHHEHQPESIGEEVAVQTVAQHEFHACTSSDASCWCDNHLVSDDREVAAMTAGVILEEEKRQTCATCPVEDSATFTIKLSELKSRVADLIDEKQELLDELVQRRQTATENPAGLTNEKPNLEGMEQRILELSRKNDDLLDENEDLVNEFDQLVNENDELMRVNCELEDENYELKSENEKLRQTSTENPAVVTIEKAELKDLHDRIAKLIKARDGLMDDFVDEKEAHRMTKFQLKLQHENANKVLAGLKSIKADMDAHEERNERRRIEEVREMQSRGSAELEPEPSSSDAAVAANTARVQQEQVRQIAKLDVKEVSRKHQMRLQTQWYHEKEEELRQQAEIVPQEQMIQLQLLERKEIIRPEQMIQQAGLEGKEIIQQELMRKKIEFSVSQPLMCEE